MIKLLYAIAKAIPALKKILDKFFGEGREFSAAVNGLRERKVGQQPETNGASGIQKGRISVPRIRRRSPQNNKSSGV